MALPVSYKIYMPKSVENDDQTELQSFSFAFIAYIYINVFFLSFKIQTNYFSAYLIKYLWLRHNMDCVTEHITKTV